MPKCLVTEILHDKTLGASLRPSLFADFQRQGKVKERLELPITSSLREQLMRIISRLTLLLLCLTIATLNARADGGFLYGLNSPGTVSVNANKIYGLSSSFDPDYPSVNTQQAWRDLALDGGNQYAIRGDGQVSLNGGKLWKLPYTSATRWFWIDLEFADGSTYALQQNGSIAVDSSVVGGLPRDNFVFTSLQVLNSATYSLRSDGSIFKNTGNTPLFTFHAGNGVQGSGDGEENDTLWVTLQVDPTGQYLYALRTDGILYRGQLNGGNTDGELVDALPFPNLVFTYGNLYSDFALLSNGNWTILRVDGEVYQAPNALTPVVDFSGSGNSAGEFFLDLALFNDQFFALRSDGKVFAEGFTDAILKLPGNGYGHIELSTSEPNLSGSKNIKPSVVTYKISTLTDSPVVVPVIATDVETPSAELTVTPGDAPAGAIWDASTRTFTWTAPEVTGKYTFSYIVADSTNSSKTYSSTVKVNAPDTDPTKNKPPYVPKIKGAAPIIGYEFRVYIPLSDPNGDPVTVTVNTADYPFNTGAYYNPATSEFVWTPSNLDIGKQTAVLTLSDGTTTKNLKLKLDVKSPLFIPPLPL
jgi:hypothetical protein